MPLYFAYGSNMNFEQMKSRCPSAVMQGIGRLEEHKIVYVGHSTKWQGAVASVIKDSKSFVPGLVYYISDTDLLELDAFEGHPKVYKRSRPDILFYGQCSTGYLPINIYIHTSTKIGKPSLEYVEKIWQEYQQRGWDDTLLLQPLAS